MSFYYMCLAHVKWAETRDSKWSTVILTGDQFQDHSTPRIPKFMNVQVCYIKCRGTVGPPHLEVHNSKI